MPTPASVTARLLLLSLLGAGLFTFLCPARDSIAEESAAPARVLILGDSISIAYTPVVRKLLAKEAVVVRPNGMKVENCQGTNHGVRRIDAWLELEGGKWDVIHFNFGLHDLKRVQPKTKRNSNDPKHPRQAEPDVYRQQLTEIVKKLKATNAKLIYATTTPVPPGGVKPHRSIEDPVNYNKIAAEIMKANDIPVNDLFSLVNDRQDELMQPVNVHFKPAGTQVLGKQVAETIRAALK